MFQSEHESELTADSYVAAVVLSKGIRAPLRIL